MEYNITKDYENVRLDRFLKKKYPNEPLSRIFQAIRKGNIKINGKKSKENYRLQITDVLVIYGFEDSSTIESKKSHISQNKTIKQVILDDEKIAKYKSWIIFENEDFFVVNKPAGIPMHKGTNYDYGLAEIYKSMYKNDDVTFAHRLDKDTSGLVIGCKTLHFLRKISQYIQERKVVKKYYAIVHGNVIQTQMILKNYLLTDEQGVKVVNKTNNKAKLAETHIKKIVLPFIKKHAVLSKITNNITCLDIDLITGRKHQIRVQLSNIGHPVIGDKKYGIIDQLNQLFLCCYYLSFEDYVFLIEEEKLFLSN